jgi:DNA processing protein
MFRQRNRIVAGMSWGVMVVEAAQRSGSFITAGCALEEGRAVMAVPGPYDSVYSRGTKQLLTQGATLVTSGQEVMQQVVMASEWEQSVNHPLSSKCSVLTPLQSKILQRVSGQPLSTQSLLDKLKMKVMELDKLEASLLQLEGLSLLKKDGNKWCRVG